MGYVIDTGKCNVASTVTARDLERLPAAGLRIPTLLLQNPTATAVRVDGGMSFAPTIDGLPLDVYRVPIGAGLDTESEVMLETAIVVQGGSFEAEYGHELGMGVTRSPNELAAGQPTRAVDHFLTLRNTGSEPANVGVLGIFGDRDPVPDDAIANLRVLPGTGIEIYLDFTMFVTAPQGEEASIDGDLEWENLTPRIGLTYDLGGDGKSLLRASYSRFADQLGAPDVGTTGYRYAYFFNVPPPDELPAAPQWYTYRFDPPASAMPTSVTGPSWLQTTDPKWNLGGEITFRYGRTTDWPLDLSDSIGEYVDRFHAVGYRGPGAFEMATQDGTNGFQIDTWRRDDLGVRYEMDVMPQWYFPGRPRTTAISATPGSDFDSIMMGDLFDTDMSSRRGCLPLSFVPFKEKVAGAAFALASIGIGIGGMGWGDSVDTRFVRETFGVGGGSTPAPVVVPARFIQFAGGGDHPPLLKIYRDATTGATVVGLSTGTGCASTEGVPAGAIVEFTVNGPGGTATWNGVLDSQARVQVVGGINAPGTYTVTAASWFLPTTPTVRNPISLGSANPSFNVPSPPSENACDPAALAPGTPLVASMPALAQPTTETRSRRVTEEKDAFPWSLPLGLGLATTIGAGLWYDNERRRKYAYDPERAKQLLDDAGWAVGSDGIREKL